MAAEKSCPENPTGDGLLPDDLVFDILLRLPLKSICRFRCVSPRWRAIIADPLFVSSHFDRSIARPVKLLQVFGSSPVDTGTDPAELRAFSAVEYPAATSDELTARYYGRIPSNAYCVSQSAGGLILFHTTDGLHVGNPSTGDYIALRPPRGEDGSDSFFGISVLGFDAIEKKHKVLCSMSSAKYVLTLGENEWRPVECRVCYFKEAMCIDGVIHIFGFDDDLEPHVILFDVRLETLRVIPFPDGYQFEGMLYFVEVGGTSGFVTSLASDLAFEHSHYELLVLEDPGNQGWKLKVLVVPSDDMCCQKYMQDITRAGVVVLKPEKESYIYLFNVEDVSIRKIKTCRMYPDFPIQRWGEEYNIVHHVESLLSVQSLRID